jgi:hypothetical protein
VTRDRQLTEEVVSRLAPVTANLIEYFSKTVNLERRDLERLEQFELLERFDESDSHGIHRHSLLGFDPLQPPHARHLIDRIGKQSVTQA